MKKDPTGQTFVYTILSFFSWFLQAVKMKAEPLKDFDEVLDRNNVSLDDFKSDDWKSIVVNHAHGNLPLRIYF